VTTPPVDPTKPSRCRDLTEQAIASEARGVQIIGAKILLCAAVGFATLSMPSYDRALWALR